MDAKYYRQNSENHRQTVREANFVADLNEKSIDNYSNKSAIHLKIVHGNSIGKYKSQGRLSHFNQTSKGSSILQTCCDNLNLPDDFESSPLSLAANALIPIRLNDSSLRHTPIETLVDELLYFASVEYAVIFIVLFNVQKTRSQQETMMCGRRCVLMN